MKYKKYFLIIIVFFSFRIESCYWPSKITTVKELADPDLKTPVQILTTDTTLYTLQLIKLNDSTISGSGTCKKNDLLEQFNGEIKLKEIVFIKSNKLNLFNTLIAVGVTGFIGITAINTLQGSGSEFREVIGSTYPSGTSCPYIYSFDGDKFYLESETFAGAIFKGAEHYAYNILHKLKPTDNKYILKLANENLETDYINEIKILSVDVPKNYQILPDFWGMIHTISNPILPLTCLDYNGNNSLEKVNKEDDVYWKSDFDELCNTSEDIPLRDGIVIEFPKPENIKNGKLVVSGKNTKLGEFAFEQLFKLKGENSLEWYYKLESDNMESKRLFSWMIREGMLHIKVWKNNKWVEQAALFDVGHVVNKEQIALLDLNGIEGNNVKIKLESATDLWKINFVYMDYSTDVPVTVNELTPNIAETMNGENITDLLTGNDNKYFQTIPGQYATIKFDVVPENPNLNRTFVLKAKGYYHVWINAEGKDQTALHNRILDEPLFGSKKYLPIWKALKEQ